MNKKIVKYGFVLILIALVSALFIPNMAIPRLGLSAHTIGILSGVLLISIGAVWQLFSLSKKQSQILYWSWLYSSYVNWLGCLTGAILGAGRMTPVASSGIVGAEMSEGIVTFMLLSVALASFVAVGLSLWGLRAAGEDRA